MTRQRLTEFFSPSKKNFWTLPVTAIASLAAVGQYRGRGAAAGFFAMSLVSIFGIRGSSVRLTITQRGQLVFFSGGLIFLGFFSAFQAMMFEEDRLEKTVGIVLALSALGISTVAVGTFLIACFARSSPTTKDASRISLAMLRQVPLFLVREAPLSLSAGLLLLGFVFLVKMLIGSVRPG